MGFKDIVSGLGNRNSDFKELVRQKKIERDAELAMLSAKERFLEREAEKKRNEQIDKEMDRTIKGWENRTKKQGIMGAKNIWKGKHSSDLCNCENMFKSSGKSPFGFGGGL